jgi:hypothetical protein
MLVVAVRAEEDMYLWLMMMKASIWWRQQGVDSELADPRHQHLHIILRGEVHQLLL